MPSTIGTPATVAELIKRGDHVLRPSDSSRLDSELLLAYALGCDRLAVYRDGNCDVAPDQRLQFESLVRARASGQPVAQLLGTAEFWSLSFHIDANVLIPRPETELLVATVLDRIPRSHPSMIADLGTGSGTIAVVIALERRNATIIASDLSTAALAVARRNCDIHCVAQVYLLRANWMDAFGEAKFDIIVSNPPYVCAGDPLLSSSAIRFEPSLALAGGDDGLDALRELVAQAAVHLKPGGCLLVEHGYNQGAIVRRLFYQQGLQRVTTAPDLAGHGRVTFGEMVRAAERFR